MITSIVYIFFALFGLLVINKKQEPISVGLVLGAGFTLSIFSLLTSIYWGQLSSCEIVYTHINKYSCKESLKSAMLTVCVFSSFMFILQISFSICLFHWRANILAESLLYTEVSNSSESDEFVLVKGGSQGSRENIVLV